MKSLPLTVLCLSGLAAALSVAQDVPPTPREGRPPGVDSRGPRFVMPLMQVLDANSDGTIDAAEITNASASLKKLDKNADGKLTPEELRPARPDRRPPPEGGQRPPPPPVNP